MQKLKKLKILKKISKKKKLFFFFYNKIRNKSNSLLMN